MRLHRRKVKLVGVDSGPVVLSTVAVRVAIGEWVKIGSVHNSLVDFRVGSVGDGDFMVKAASISSDSVVVGTAGDSNSVPSHTFPDPDISELPCQEAAEYLIKARQ